MAFPITQKPLRLVHAEDAPERLDAGRSSARAVALADVERENRAAARLSALDARWILAVQVDRALTGGRAAIITPDARDRLLALGERVGLRPFDVSLVIAIVQDAARGGEDPLGRMSEDRLRLVRPSDIDVPFESGSGPWRGAWVAVCIGTLTLSLAIAWLLSRWIMG